METWSCFLDREHTAFRRRAIPRVAGAGGGCPLAQRPLLWARPSGGIRIGTVRSGLPVPPSRTGGLWGRDAGRGRGPVPSPAGTRCSR